ncbi:hypothetical protein Tco_0590230 [Tanacetum coccineum]
MPGRPRKKRIRAAHEEASGSEAGIEPSDANRGGSRGRVGSHDSANIGVSRNVVSRGAKRGVIRGGRNSIPLPIWPNGVPLPSASAIARGSQTSASIQVPMSSQLQNEYADANHVQK